MNITLAPADWLSLLLHFLSLSLLAVGGAITTVPDMHRYLVDEAQWLSDPQFTSCIALAQAAPGPNVLFVALMGWYVGINSVGATHSLAWCWGLLGVFVCMLGILLPSTTLTFAAARWGHQNREMRAVRAFKQGMAPIVIALLVATGWILASGHGSPLENPPLWLVATVATLLVWHTRMHLLVLMAAGGLLGWMGWV